MRWRVLRQNGRTGTRKREFAEPLARNRLADSLGYVEADTQIGAIAEAMRRFASYGLNATNIVVEYAPIAEY